MVGAGFAAVKALGVAGQFASGLMSAKARQAEFADQLRNIDVKKQQTLGIARARAAASGITMDSASTVDYLAGLTGEFDREAGMMRKLASTVETTDLLGNLSTLVGGGADTYASLGALNDWWKTKKSGPDIKRDPTGAMAGV